jgi:hypothetical protein
MGQSKFVSTPYDELTYKIIGCAMASHRGLGPGLREDTYQRDLEVHLAQVIGYLAVSGCPIGLLINFGLRSLQHRRVMPPKSIQEHHVNRQWLFVPDWMKGGVEK